jgi:tRNA(Ile)-lysidine synthase
MADADRSLGVAVSGGADSVSLLAILGELFPGRITVLHLNHGLRGEASDGDETFVREAAARAGAPCIVERVHDLRGPNLEEKARQARYEFFARAAAECGLARVATAHTLDDQAETFLLRLLRGAGATGLGGIQPVTAAGIIRPLLEVTRPEIESWLREHRIEWREDLSNRDPAFARNRIRHDLLPLLERDWNPALRRSLARTADVLSVEESYWREWTAQKLAELSTRSPRGLVLELAGLRSLHLAALRRLLRAAVEVARGNLLRIDKEHIDRLVRLCLDERGSGAVRLPGLAAVRSFQAVLLTGSTPPRHNPEIKVSEPGPIYLGDGGSLYIRYNTDGVSTGSIEPPVVVRGWRPGDAYRPAGSVRTQKLKDLFQEHKVPSWERRDWPIIESDGRIVWARRFGMAAGVELGWTCEDAEMNSG